MHTELRVRTVCELVGHEEHYLRPEVTSFHGGFVDDQMCRGRLHATSANYDSPRLQQDPSGSNLEQQIFILDCLDTTKDGTYCNISHIHALSSVLKCKIRSIYPDYNHYVRPLLNKEVSPRQGICNNPCDKPVYIMWTRTVPMVGCSWWSPNHFVPCIPTLSENRHSIMNPSHCAANVSSRISTSNLATTTVGSKSSFKHAGQQPPSDSDNSIN